MKSSAISLVLSVILPLLGMGAFVRAAVDIFSGMDSTTEESTDIAESEIGELDESLPTCVSDVYPKDSIQFDGKLFSLESINSTIRAIPKAPPMPDLTQTWSRFTNMFQLPRISEMGQELKTIIDEYRAVAQLYTNQWMGFVKQRHQASMAKVHATVTEINKKIHDSFANHLEEFRDVCLPDSNTCLQSIQKGITSYEQRLNENVAACRMFAKRQVDQHEAWIERERSLLERPFLRVEDCFAAGRVGISLVSCVGNMVGNVAKVATDGMNRFSGAMANVSDSLTVRLGKFQECVVNRKKLLDRGQERIAEHARGCLQKQQQEQRPTSAGEVFGGDGEEDVDDVF